MEEAQHDPVKKASLIRDIVGSISKIPDLIQQEVYVQETSRIMDISEEVLFSSLAQLAGKPEKKRQPKTQQFEVVRDEQEPRKRISELYVLEKSIITLLLLYGGVEEEFEDLLVKVDAKGELELEPEWQTARVYEKIFLDLQEDEVAFTNENFREIYQKAMERYQREETLNLETFVNELSEENAAEVSGILMDEEQYILHDWERKDIFVKDKKAELGRLVSETILSLRRYLVNQKINELSGQMKEASPGDSQDALEDIMDYISLKKLLSNKLNRVM